MKRKILTTTAVVLAMGIPNAWSFCGFFVAKADTDLFNRKSEVILVRDGEKTTVTMSNDFKGDVKDFAMIVPVPVVPKDGDIRVVERNIFDKFDAYSAPRLAEYYDATPCYKKKRFRLNGMRRKYSRCDSYGGGRASAAPDLRPRQKNYQVTIEAKYAVGEYDIMVLSAKESNGLKEWLNDNDYKLPKGAEEVLDPYIKNGMKFFVAKVNVEKMEESGFALLSPLQISYSSSKFMLPIRLGMANSAGEQDLVVYAFTKSGRVETTNYRTVKLPTDNNVPLFIKDHFGEFYKDVYARAHEKEEGKVVFLEYAWDLSANNIVKCDPCVSPPPIIADMRKAGVDWLVTPPNTFSNQYTGSVFFTRLHVRYNRTNFPQDLAFQETPNTERYQGRYVIHHPATGKTSCKKGRQYKEQLAERKEKELVQLAELTGWNIMKYQDYIRNYNGTTSVVEPPRGEPNPNDCGCDDTIDVPTDGDGVEFTPDNSNENNNNESNTPVNIKAKAYLIGRSALLVSLS